MRKLLDQYLFLILIVTGFAIIAVDHYTDLLKPQIQQINESLKP